MTKPPAAQSTAIAPSAPGAETSADDARSFAGAVANPIRTQI